MNIKNVVKNLPEPADIRHRLTELANEQIILQGLLKLECPRSNLIKLQETGTEHKHARG